MQLAQALSFPQSLKCQTQTHFLNPNPFNWWYGIENVARVRVNGEKCMAVLNNGVQIKTIMTESVEKSLPGCQASLGPHRWISHLCMPGKNCHSTYWLCYHTSSSRWSWWLRWGSNIPPSPRFVQLLGLGPCNPGNPHNWPHHKCDKREGDRCTGNTWVNAHVAYLLAVWWVTSTLEDDKVTTRVLDSTEYNEVVTTKGNETIDALSSRIIHTWMKTTFTSVRLNVMTDALHAEEGSLPQGLMIQNTYTKIQNGSKNVTIIVRNNMVYPQSLEKKILMTRVVAASWVPEPQMWPGMIDMLDEAQGIQMQ